MMRFDRKSLFYGLRTALKPAGGFNDRQVTSIGAIVDEFERRKLPDMRWLAYILATVWHESRFEPVREIGRGKGKPYGKPHKITGQTYYGRGFVQLTWYENYAKFENTLKLPLLKDPGMALVVPVATAILFEGMTTGITAKDSFTKYQLHDWFNDSVDDPVNARRIINGTDKAKLIAGYHAAILDKLNIAKRDAPALPPSPVEADPARVETEVRDGTAGGAAAGGGGAVIVGGAVALHQGFDWKLVGLIAGVAVLVGMIAWTVYGLRKDK